MYGVKEILLVVGLVLAAVVGQSLAATEAERLQYIGKILSLLNSKTKCVLPNYEEIDVLLKSFQGLDKSKLTTDHEILASTVLDQWASFQKYLRVGAKGTVVSNAKRLAYEAKVIEYQKMKYGFSVCENERDRRYHDDDDDDDDDQEFQKNPLVRYLKHLREVNRNARKSRVTNYHSSAHQANPVGFGTDLRPAESHTSQQESQEVDQKSHASNWPGDQEQSGESQASNSLGDQKQSQTTSTSQSSTNKGSGRPYRGTFTYHSNARPSRIIFHVNP